MEDPAARRARLKAIREAAEAAGDTADAADAARVEPAREDPPATQEPVLKFRNYAVRDEKIEHRKVEPAQVPEFEEVRVDLDAVIGKDADEVLINVAPKKANWDLRRDIAPKLAKLERRTQRAMVQLAAQEEAKRAQEEADAN